MSRVKTQTELGFRWLRCGWRLFQRNPWLLGGMGLCVSLLFSVLSLIPFIGPPLIGLLAPVLFAGFYLSLDQTAKQKLRLPHALRFIAVRQSPREFLVLFRDESRSMQIVIIGLYSMVVVVLADIIMWLIAGTALTHRAAALPANAVPRLILSALVGISIYAVVAASLVYALPLALLGKEPLVPAVARSFKASGRYAFALAVLAVLLAAPLVLGAVASRLSIGFGYLVGMATAAVALPLLAASFYCSYRTLFTTAPATARIDRPSHKAHRARTA